MKKPLLSLAAICGLMLSFTPAGAAAPNDYQVTGPIVSMTDTMIVVKKGQENWELSKDAAFKPADGSELRVGDRVTIHYTMAAKTVERKEAAKREKKPPVDKKKKADAAASPASSPAASPQKPGAEVSPRRSRKRGADIFEGAAVKCRLRLLCLVPKCNLGTREKCGGQPRTLRSPLRVGLGRCTSATNQTVVSPHIFGEHQDVVWLQTDILRGVLPQSFQIEHPDFSLPDQISFTMATAFQPVDRYKPVLSDLPC